MERRFDTDCKWVWYVHAILTVMVIVAYCMTSGREVLFAIYIPLDILLNLSAVVFFWYERYKDKVKKDRIKRKE